MSKHEQLAALLQRQIASGIRPAGARLPSIRKMAEQHSCSAATVIRAYEQLIREHFVYVVDRSGYYVAAQHQTAPAIAEGEQIDIASAAPAAELFPFDDFQGCLNQAMKLYRDQLFTYGTAQGLPALLHEVREQLERVQVFARPANLYITSGVQQALSILTMMPFPGGQQRIMIEQPGYHLLIELLESLNVPVVQVERTSCGLDMEQIEEWFQTGEIKFFYLMPRFHNPLGHSLAAIDKKKLVVLAERYDVYLVEDDYLADLEQHTGIDPLYAYDRSDHVIYLKSYSKMLFPGLRIGVAVLPDCLTATFSRYKKLLDIDSSVLSQAALQMYIKNGMYARYRRLMLEAYRRRTKRLHAAICELAASDPLFARVYHIDAVHAVLPLPDNFPMSALLRRLQELNIVADSLDRYFMKDSPYRWNGLRINVSNVQEERIAATLQIVAAQVRRLIAMPLASPMNSTADRPDSNRLRDAADPVNQGNE